MADSVYTDPTGPILAAFPSGRRDPDGVRIPCPVHGGTSPNVHVWPDPATAGRWQVHCHSRQCDSLALVKAIEGAAGVSLGRHAPRQSNNDDYIEGVYYTTDGKRTTAYRKDWPADWNGEPCGWRGCKEGGKPHKHMWQDRGAPTRGLLLLEHRPAEPAEPDVAAIVEGEKTARAVRAAGWTAYSYMGGSGKASFADYSPVKGKRVVVLPDADTAGRKAATVSARKAKAAGAASVHVVQVDAELETGADAADVSADEIDATIRAALATDDSAVMPDEPLPDADAGAGVPNSALQDGLFELDLTSDGFAKRLLDAEASRLLLARYKTREGPLDDKPYHLDSTTGLWVQDSPLLRRILSDLAERELVTAFRQNSRMTPKVLSAAKRMREQPASEAIGRLGVAANRWKEGEATARDRERYRSELTTCNLPDLDRNGRYLGCENGVLDLEGDANGPRLLPPVEGRRHLVTRSTGVKYDAAATHPAVDKLTSHLSPDLSEYLWAALGRALWAQPDKALTFIVGDPHGGKSTLFKAVDSAIGGEAGTISEDLVRLTRKQAGKAGPTPERESLVTCRLVHAVEAGNWSFDVEKLKAFAGSYLDSIAYQPKYESERMAPIRATIFIAANEHPRSLDLLDQGFADRYREIPYPVPSVREAWVGEAFAGDDPAAARAMLAKLGEYAWRYKPGVEPVPPAEVETAIAERIAEAQGPIGQWLASALVRDDYVGISTAAVWTAWAAYNETDPKTDPIADVWRNSLPRRVRAAFHVSPQTIRYEGRVAKGWKGLRLRTERDAAPGTPATETATPAETQATLADALAARIAELEQQPDAPPQVLEALRGVLRIKPDEILTRPYLAGIQGGAATVVQKLSENAANMPTLVNVDYRVGIQLCRDELDRDMDKAAERQAESRVTVLADAVRAWLWPSRWLA